MKKQVLPVLALALTLSFSACKHADNVEPQPTISAADAARDQLFSDIAMVFRNIVAKNGSSINQAQARTMLGALTPQQIRAAFDAFDVDRSGQISANELQQVLGKSGVTVIAAQCAQLIKMFDANNSGTLEFNEFERLISEALKHAK